MVKELIEGSTSPLGQQVRPNAGLRNDYGASDMLLLGWCPSSSGMYGGPLAVVLSPHARVSPKPRQQRWSKMNLRKPQCEMKFP